jgi:3-hydroxyisobutyrate dehydrogenase-like beta-hydroxyacid dehydrogenase
VTLNIGFIGFGEVGQLFARQLEARPGVSIAVYDLKFDDPALRSSLARMAQEIHARFASDARDVCRGAEIVISAVTADQAIAAARVASPNLVLGQTYVDLNSVSPTTKREVGAAIRVSGANFVEFAVMSPVADLGIASPILAGGAEAETLAERLNALGMNIRVVDAEIGVASATKLCRSIVVKGMEALMVDLGLAGRRAGVLPAVLASLAATYPGMDWDELVRTMPSRVTRHGVRRAAEMREAARMLDEMGLSGALAEAIANRHESYARASGNAVASGTAPFRG